ncbi:MAG: chloride channel protein [Eubacterium sp.]|nr:chloride channel protein [Eubacterium sp.]MDE6767017.1 chloride channel protein [Eubacterium sp.]
MDNKMPNMDYDADEVINEFKEKIKWPKSEEVTAVVKPSKVPLRILISLLITAVVGGAAYYMMLPAFNIHDTQMYIYLILLVAVFIASFAFVCKANKKIERKEYVKKKSLVPLIIIGVLVAVMAIGYVTGITLFRANSYSELMQVTDGNFETDFDDISYDKVPRVDASRAHTLADQQLGSLSEYKSQYVVSANSTQINYKNTPVRVAYLEYADVFKWINNTKNGLPAYMFIDLVSQKVTAVNCVEQFGEGIKYSPTELFNEKIYRHLRFQYPTALLDVPNFEIDDNMHPYWITAVLDKKIGLFGGTDVKGVIITDALNGDSNYYDIEQVRTDADLSWIDVVYSESLLIEQYNYHGKLQNGFWNSIIFQNDVNVASSGSGNIAMDDDVWVYTGVTSSESDASNFGFILCNQRTKETRYYENAGAMEEAAQKSARDAVQNYGYYATFPILLGIDGTPTYFMSLYGDSNTVKGYAFVSLEDKTVVGTGLLDVAKSDAKALNSALENYIDALQEKGVADDVDKDNIIVDENELGSSDNNTTDTPDTNTPNTDVSTVTGEVTDIKSSVNDGNTVYYLQIEGKYYYIKVTDAMEVLLISNGDTITVEFEDSDDTFIPATSVKVG